MRRNKTPLVILVVVVGVYAIAKGLMYVQVKSSMDDIVAGAADVAEITYQGISTELLGAASVEGIAIRPRSMQQAIHIDRARFSSDDPLALMTGGDWQEREPPEQMRFDLHGIRVSLDEQMIQALRAAEGGAASADVAGDACGGDFNNLDPSLLRELGFEELRIDAGMDYHFDVRAESLLANIDFDIEQIESVHMSIELDGVVPQDVAKRAAVMPALARAEMRVDVSRNFGDRYMQLCAQRHGQTVQAYHADLVAGMQADLAESGVTLGAGLQQAMEEMYRDWGEFQITLRPEEPLGPVQLMQITPQDAVDVLGLSMRVNGRPVTNLSFDFDMQALMAKAQIQQQGAQSNLPRPELPKRVRITRRYQAVPVTALQEHIGANVRIQPRGQPQRSGDLIAIAGGEAQIRQRTHGGSFTSHVPINEIKSVEVQIVERELIDENR